MNPEATLIPLVEKLVKLADDKDVIAKRRLELLREVLDQIFPHPDTWNEIFDEELIDRLTKELA